MIREYIHLSRPFTLLAPMLGVVSGALTAWGSEHNPHRGFAFGFDELLLVAGAAVSAALLNAASNGVNQIYDLNIDRINKPDRPLVANRLSVGNAGVFTVVAYALSISIAWLIVSGPNLTWSERLSAPLILHETFFFYLIAGVFTLIYSVPLLGRTKQHTFGANLTIAIPRGLLLKVAGWSVLAPVSNWEPWYIGLCFFLFLIGAASTKDFSDLEGDRHGECQTLPNRYGVRRAAYLISPCFVVPWLLIPLGVWVKPDGITPLLTGSPPLLYALGVSLILWGSYTVFLIMRDPEALATEENHPSWKHMYLMMLWAQIGFALAYLIQ